MSYSVKVRSGGTTIGPDGTVVETVVTRFFWDGVPFGQGTHKRIIKPADDISTDTSRAARLADAVRKIGNDETTATVRVR